MEHTKQQVEAAKAGLRIMMAVSEAIREAKRIPSGTLYATLMGKMDMEAYGKMIAMLKNTGLVIEQGHELIWNGPTFEGGRQ